MNYVRPSRKKAIMLLNVQVKPRLRENLKTSNNGEESFFDKFSVHAFTYEYNTANLGLKGFSPCVF